MFITPNPKEYTRDESRFYLAKEIFVHLPQNTVKAAYKPILTELFGHYTAEKVTAHLVESDTVPAGVCVISNEPCAKTAPQSTKADYELTVKSDGAVVLFNDYAGLFHGIAGFLQMIRPDDTENTIAYYVRGCSVRDEPSVHFRAVHLCVFHQTTLEYLKKSIMLCGMMKYTHIILEFWGMYRYRCCPNLGWKEAYTEQEIRPLVLIANAMGMEVVPMLNHLGHASGARVCYGKHAALDNDLTMAPYFEEDGWSWCTSNPKTLRLLADCRRELIDLCGEGKFFHIGFDEAYEFGKCDRCAGKEPKKLMKEHLLRTVEDLLSLGRRPIMWADMVLDPDKFDSKKYFFSGTLGKDILKEIPKEVILADWQYVCKDEEFKTSIDLAEQGFDVVACPWDSRENVRSAAITARNRNLFGMIETTWHTLPDIMYLIPLAADEMWGSPLKQERFSFDAYAPLCAAYNIRRCVPPMGRYERAGFKKDEIPEI